MSPRRKQQIGGGIFLLIGLWFAYTFWQWFSVQTTEWVAFFVVSACGPGIAVLGAAVIAMPFTPTGQYPAAGGGLLQRWQRLSPRWKAVLVLAIVVNTIYLYFLGVL